MATPDGAWLFGPSRVGGRAVEVARMRVEVPAGAVVESRVSAVRASRRMVSWRGHHVPVVPLEVQLASCAGRGLHARAAAIRAALDRGA